jgi:ubiquinone/menaquinone biosynthesis C-methylase UbiE
MASTVETSSPAGALRPSTMSERMASYMEEPLRGFVREMSRVLEAIGVAPGMNVADVGAGTGVATEALAKNVTRGGARDGRVYALDISPYFIQGLLTRKARLAESDPVAAAAIEAHLIGEADLGDIVPDGSLDLVVLVDVAHHLKQPEGTFRSITRALKSGSGRVAIIENDRAKFMEALARAHPQAFLQLLQANLHAQGGHSASDGAASAATTFESAAAPSEEDVAAAVVKAREVIAKVPPFSAGALTSTMQAAGLTLTVDLGGALGIDDISCVLIFTKTGGHAI